MRINIFHFLYIFKHTIKIQILWHSIPSILLDFIVLFSPEKKKCFFISLRFLSSNYLNDIPRKLYSENNINFSINPKSCFKFLSSLTVEFSWKIGNNRIQYKNSVASLNAKKWFWHITSENFL